MKENGITFGTHSGKRVKKRNETKRIKTTTTIGIEMFSNAHIDEAFFVRYIWQYTE